ncbi:MAG: hypothetical protein IPK82_31890 [Polyangiaceae bacterium]|nr:hypothetical protein [Polyangiaceae bacterium]
MKSQFFVGLAAAVFFVGCGGNVSSGTGGSGGDGGAAGGAGTTSSGGTTNTSSSTLPQECTVETTQPGPYEITLRFTNPTDNPVGGSVFLRKDCLLNYSIRECADGFQNSLGLSGACTVDCSQSNECIECGACPTDAVEIALGAQHDEAWSGLVYTFAQNNVGCSCHEEHVAPAQTYRVYVPVYASALDAQQGEPSFQAIADFPLPSAGAVVVNLYPPPI